MKDFKLEEALSAPFLKHNEIVYFPVVFENDGESFSIINNGTAVSPCRITIVITDYWIKLGTYKSNKSTKRKHFNYRWN